MTGERQPDSIFGVGPDEGELLLAVLQSAAFGAALEAMGDDYGTGHAEAAQDAAREIVEAVTSVAPDVEAGWEGFRDLVAAAASTGVAYGLEMRRLRAVEGRKEDG